LEDNTVWTWLSKTSLAVSLGTFGWDELISICLGWLIIGLFHIIPEDAGKPAKLVYTLAILCIAAAVFWLFLVPAPLANGVLLVGLFGAAASGIPWPCLCISPIIVGGLILMFRKKRYV
jgi:hypothetical protein